MRSHHIVRRLMGVAAAGLLALSAAPAQATLNPTLSETGKIFFSIDGLGTNDVAGGIVEVEKPAGATVRTAFLSCAATGGGGFVIPDGAVTINGTGVTWSQNIANGIFPSNTFGDVTAIIKPVVDIAPTGRVAFTLAEGGNTFSIDGCALGVVLDDPAQTSDSSVLVSFGGQATAGDTFSITLGQPLDLIDPSSKADMGLAISFGAQTQVGLAGGHICGTDSGMDSQVDVNGTRLTSCAGDQDDGVGPVSNGLLFTVGGLDDTNANPADPFQRAADGATPRVNEDELYDLKPFVSTGDTLISVNTINPSSDDNIFLAYFVTSVPSIVGEGVVLGPASATNPVGTTHTVTATVVDDGGNPVVGRSVSFVVLSGPHAGTTGSALTGLDGKASFTYLGSSAGTDLIQASFVDLSGVTRTSNTVEKIWQSVVTTTTSVVTTTTSSTTTTTVPSLDHFQCYEVKPSVFSTGPVTVQDLFGSLNATLRFPHRLCNPTNKNGEGIIDPTDHLVGYTARFSKFVRQEHQLLVDQFGSLFLDLSRPDLLMVPSSKDGVAQQPPLDHFQCYKVKRSRGTAKFVKRNATISNQFETLTTTVLVVAPVRVCAPANKNGEDPTAPGHPDHLTCYKTRGPRFTGSIHTVTNQFGADDPMQVIHRRELCVPSLRNPPPTTTTSTTVATTSTTVATTSTTVATTSTTVATTTTTSSTTTTTIYGSPSRAFLIQPADLLD